jgi:TetR/AcrR family transcriptional regulator, mexJK operon transcriptional repressor
LATFQDAVKMNGRRGSATARIPEEHAPETTHWGTNQKAGRPTLDELERRKLKIMQAATSLFVRDGYAGTSLVDIAKGAGVATRTVYQHFGDKEAMFRHVMFARETAAVFAPPAIEPEDALFDIIVRAANYIHEVSLRPTTVDLMRLTISESRRFPELTKKLTDATYSRFRANVKGMFDELVQRGLVNDKDTALSAAMFVDLILGTTPLLVYAGWQSPPARYSQLNHKIELFIQGRFGPAAAASAHQSKRSSREPQPTPAKGEKPVAAARTAAAKQRRAG